MNIPVKYVSQHVHVKDNLVHTQLIVAYAGGVGVCSERPEKRRAGAGANRASTDT